MVLDVRKEKARHELPGFPPKARLTSVWRSGRLVT